MSASPNSYVIPTALTEISSSITQWHRARAIFDTGSEINIISEPCAKRCNLMIKKDSSSVNGVGGTPSIKVLGMTTAYLRQPQLANIKLEFCVLAKTTMNLPSQPLPRSHWPHFEELDLADPHFHVPSSVDLILASGVLNQVCTGQIFHPLRSSPVAHSTTLGWIISGSYSPLKHKRVTISPKVETILPRDEFKNGTIINHTELVDHKPILVDTSLLTVSPSTRSSQPPQHQRSSGPGFRYTRPSFSPVPALTQDFLNSTNTATPVSYSSNFYAQTLSSSSFPEPSSITLSANPTPLYSSISLTNDHSQEPQYAALLEKMFRLESVSDVPPYTPDELLAEEYFRKSCSRLPDGRFSVGLPISKNPALLRNTRQIAMRRLFNLENRHRKNPVQRNSYVAFMKEYLESGHMELVPPPATDQITYYLPHHSVCKPDDPPTKIRVVFNASQASPSGLSLNDILLPGPRLQLDIGDVVTKFRQDRYVFVADIKQMFRQIEHPLADRDLLRIVWRFNMNSPVQDFRLKTVTYGTASAPFLAGRVLKELAVEHMTSHPDASHILRYRTYVDDVNGGGNTIESALAVRNELQSLLELGKMELRKWAANDLQLLADLPEDHLLPSYCSISMDDESDSVLKVLGLRWNPVDDSFHYKPSPVSKIHTKRELASQIAKIFDPLGWLIPITVFARILFRQIVQGSYNWDEVLPKNISDDWSLLAHQLPQLSVLKIPRFIPSISSNQYLVGFADASERAYAAVLYVVSIEGNSTTVRLVTARARMAPIKPVSLPRLELCAAQLLASLLKRQISSNFVNLDPNRIFMYSDSTIVLSWITANPAPVWKVFVGNRVADILSCVPASQWFHIPSNENPADCASRGLRPTDLIENDLWWRGPEWLSRSPREWHFKRIRPELNDDFVRQEVRTPRVTLITHIILQSDIPIEERFSNYPRLQAVVAWSLRFYHNSSKRGIPLRGPLSACERRNADIVLVKRAQAQGLKEELADVQSKRPKMRITKSLNLFLDSEGILRVGGRLRNSMLAYSVKHPALLPSKHRTTDMIIRWTHQWSLHIGPLGTLANIRGRYWIVNGKNIVRRALKNCTKCIRTNPKPFEPPMGDLPKDRLLDIAPFYVTGVDYAGPFIVRASTLRSSKKMECYLCIFVCFATRAVHIEVATDLSTPSFLLAFQSFAAIRGLPAVVWSDNGRNFLGASNELKRLQSLLASSTHQALISSETAKASVEWHFIPPRAPHFGGLWEAAVRSAKQLLRKTVGSELLDMDIFRAFVAQVSAVLNSRPLSAISSSPNDLSFLTPGHFLIFRPLVAPPIDPDITERSSIRGKWQKAQFLLKRFWTQWKKEYLLDLQARTKWQDHNTPKAKVGDIVLIMDDNQPPMHWTMGKIDSLITGNDGIPRIANVKTAHGVIQRLVRKLCPLVTEEDTPVPPQVSPRDDC